MKDLQKEISTLTSESQKKDEASSIKIKELERENGKIAGQYQRENEKKQKTWEQEKKTLEEEIDELKDEIESITLDRDLAEESRAELEQENDTLKGKLEILEAAQSKLFITN